jgi:hypothetical protein
VSAALSQLAQAALAYAENGWPVEPLHSAPGGRCSCGKPNCTSPGKHPRTENGFKDASADPAVIRAWWARWPDANIGMMPGAAGLLAIDVDGPDGERAAQARGLLSEPTLEVITGRVDGGRHRWYRHPGGMIGNAPLGPHLDVRADGGYVLLPPSIHPTGRVYRWVGKLTEVAELPPPIIARLRNHRPAARHSAPGGLRLQVGERNTTLAAIAGSLRRRGCSPDQIVRMLAPLNADALEPVGADELGAIARSIARYAPSAAPKPALAGNWEGFK